MNIFQVSMADTIAMILLIMLSYITFTSRRKRFLPALKTKSMTLS